MTRRRRVAAGLAAIGLVVVAGWWWLRGDGSTADEPAGQAAGATPRPTRLTHDLPGARRWLGQLGLEPRRVAGRVTYRGAPASAATVRLELPRERRHAVPPVEVTFSMQASSAVTDGDGRLSLGGLAPGRYLLAARDAGQRTAEEVDAVAVVGGGEDVTLRLVAMVTVRGRVVEEDGEPVAGARVAQRTGRFLRAGRSFVSDAKAVTQADGGFVLDAVPPGAFAIAVDEYEVLEPASAEAVAPETEVRVVVASKARVAGRVTRDGTPVAGAAVRLMGSAGSWGGSAKTGADGAYQLGGIDPGSYEIGAQSDSAFARKKTITVARGQRLDNVDSYTVFARDGGRSDQATVEVVAGKRAIVRLTSLGSATFLGRAVDLVTRQPLAGFACDDSGDWEPNAEGSITDAQGRFELEIPAGRSVEIECTGRTAGLRARGSKVVRLEASAAKEVLVEVFVARRGPVHGDLGLHINPGPPAIIDKVVPGGLAERAGVAVDDTVLKVDGIDVRTFESSLVWQMMLDHAIGEKVELVLGRDGREIPVAVEVVQPRQ